MPSTTIIFLHGFFASGSCIPALALKEAMEGKARVVTPDLPRHPHEALSFIRELCLNEKPRLLVGNSCGAFLAQIIAPQMGVKALLGNPHFAMSLFLRERLGPKRYKSPRADGKQDFVIDKPLVDEYAELEKTQFDHCSPLYADKVWGLFGDHDPIAHYEPLFLKHYTKSFHFPGAHTPTAEEVKAWYAPLAQQLMRY